MASSEVLQKLEQRAHQAEEMIIFLKNQIQEVRKEVLMQTFQAADQKLQSENAKLRNEIELCKSKLIQLEIKNGIKQIPIPGEAQTGIEEIVPALTSGKTSSDSILVSQSSLVDLKGGDASNVFAEENKGKKTAKEVKDKKKAGNISAKTKSDEQNIDVGRLDFRIGRIVSAKKHPDADALYVEDVDIGEEKHRTVVSGLVKFVPLEEMQGRIVMLLCNLKPAKMRGILSEAMVMCASTPEKVEILIPPNGSVPGDIVICKGYDGRPDQELNPKKKIFEQVAPDLKTDNELKATYKGIPLEVPGKGFIIAPSLHGVQIK